MKFREKSAISQKTNLQKYIMKNFYNDKYYENIDFVKKVLEVYFLDIRKKKNYIMHMENQILQIHTHTYNTYTY